MASYRNKHRPLLSGLEISSQRESASGRGRVGGGTLTGLARRNSDGKKALVTCLHVMAGLDDDDNYQNPVGDEEMYQGLANRANKVGSDLAWAPLTSTGTNYVDVAMCELEDGVDAKFQMHDTPQHSNRRVIEGVAAAKVGMRVRVLGGSTGEQAASITYRCQCRGQLWRGGVRRTDEAVL